MIKAEQNLEALLRSVIAGIGRKTSNPEIAYDPQDCEFTISVNPHDQGRFIGKKGIVFWGIQTLFWHAGINEAGRTAGFSLTEPDNPITDRRGIPFRADPNWDRSAIKAMLQQISELCFDGASAALQEGGETEATALIASKKSLQSRFSDPDLAEAARVVIKAAGMAHGCILGTRVTWE